MSPKKYLALVNTPGEFTITRLAGGIQLSLSFILAGRGLPPPPNSWAAVPIAPTPSHPNTARSAVHANSQLPWPDCYIHTLEILTARVSRIYQHRTPGPCFSEDEHGEIMYHSGMDSRADSMARRAAAAPVAQPPPEPARLDDGERMNAGPKVDESDPTAVLLEMFPNILADGRPEMKYHVQMWINLADCDEVACPADLRAEKKRLREIEWSWAERTIASMLSKKPQTTAWLAGVEGADDPAIDAENGIDPMDEDESILPEDAIEHRAERAMLAERFDAQTPGCDPVVRALNASLPTAAPHGPSIASPDEILPTHTNKGNNAVNPRPERTGLSVFRWILSRAGSLLSNFKLFFLGLLWRKPFPK
ncbi:hypothetical protein AURDEDRAFT_116244 [Auricularia subglabra TFB-10046 SS5]|nr:hypothetical protein AURDEDRAFT_116244 [Auricularia subglabra TFB-10046 SS5]